MQEFFILYWKYILEILILWFFYYMFLAFIQGTRTVQVVKGLAVLVLLFIFTVEMNLTILNWILTKLFTISIIAFFIIFQPELRRGLARIGQFGMFSKEKETLDEISKAVVQMSSQKIGALIAIEREIGLKTYVESGVYMDSQLSMELITSLFSPDTILHDGGIIIQNGRLIAAGCLFPLTQNPSLPKVLGTRHRAAIGLSEETDALVIVISEETGGISIVSGGRITKNISDKEFPMFLHDMYRPKRLKKSIFDFLFKSASRLGGPNC